jgi:mannonate dehydratase
MYKMIQTMRWYGPNDPVSLSDILQAGCSGVVSALHHIKNGEIWTETEILKRKQEIEAAGLTWNVVESVPVHENIKTRSGNFKTYIENYKTSIENLSKHNIKTVCYNFMPILDWSRTNLEYVLPNGAKALLFELKAIAAFDLFILKRENAKKSYSETILSEAEKLYKSFTEEDKTKLTRNIIAGLPGAEEGYTVKKFQESLDGYKGINHEKLALHLKLFLDEIIPVCKSVGVNMCIHPDDPPFDIFGLPRVVSTAKDIRRIFSETNFTNNGLTFCTGSFGVISENDLAEMLKEFGERVHFLHLRSTKRDRFGNFYEDNHLEGDVPMFEIVEEVVKLQQKRNVSLPMRPDHGHQMLDDLYKKTNPGYSAIGRLKGLAELRGLEHAIVKQLEKQHS